MTRREMLTRMLGAAVAAAVAPLIDLTDQTPAFWNQPALQKVMPWRISFPDGTTWSFDAEVVAEQVLANGDVSLSVRPSGPMKLEQLEVEDIHKLAGHLPMRNHREPVTAHGTIIKREGVVIGELQDIEAPALSNIANPSNLDDIVLGRLQRIGTMKFTVKFP